MPKHPASKAWDLLTGQQSSTQAYPINGGKSSKIVLLKAEPSEHKSIIAKLSKNRLANREIQVYKDILPIINVTHSRLLGEVINPDGTTWIFLEYVSGRSYDPGSPADQILAGELLGRLHSAGANITQNLYIKTSYNLESQLREATQNLQAVLLHRELSPQGKEVVIESLDWANEAAKHLETLEHILALSPITFIHGDFHALNLIVKPKKGGRRRRNCGN